MVHELKILPFAYNALEPMMSEETLHYHHDKHHAGYVTKLNGLIKGTLYESKTLEEIIKSADGPIFNNAAQVYNHDFFWNSLSPKATNPSETLSSMIDKEFGSMEDFKKSFIEKAVSLFGSGWVWLCIDKNNKLSIEQTKNADTPIRFHLKPLLTCDVWEHAYYIDYRNMRPDYLDNWWRLINWEFVSNNLNN